MAESVVKCLFCEEASKYSCPQCGIRYCSVKCYQNQKHLECSETFYKEQVTKELKGMKGSNEDKQQLMKMLAKLNKERTEQHGCDKNDTNICERLNDVCLDDIDEVWKHLTDNEKENFQKRIKTGNLDFIDLWLPWWTNEKKSKVIDMDQTKKNRNIPKILKDMPHLQDLLQNKKPDENVVYNVIEIILAYTYLMRLFNGDLYDSPNETVDVMLMLSKVLSENQMYSDLETCLFCFIQNVEVKKELAIDPVSISLNDLENILSSNDHYCVRALSDFYLFIKRYRKVLKKNEEEHSSNLYKLSKKVYFLLVYCQDREKKVHSYCDDVKLLRNQILQEKKLLNEQKEDIEANLTKLRSNCKPLIQEL